ncbi:uncharacterized protein LOC121414302 [Lytechinus variegatus]|uniref:uncharacterized protein LOC121414302 n=1 Tax=Lytechinus variegatus TaxID=7654 RepID=UPI001BB29D27|nr:uncharacterized protein LOC121414302 [Lytechinus variegatus]
MYGRSVNPAFPPTHSTNSNSTRSKAISSHKGQRTPTPLNRDDGSRKKQGKTETGEKRKQSRVKGHDLSATGKSLHVPVYKPMQAPVSPQKSDVFHKLLSSELHPGHTKSDELELRPLHVKCSCGNLKNRKPGVVSPIQSSSSDESEDEGEGDEKDQRGYDVADLIKLLIIQETKQGQQRSGSILRNLARSVTIGEDVTEVQLHQLLRLVTSHIGCVREAALLTLKQAGKISHLASMLLESGALGRVIMLLHGEHEGAVITAGCQFLEEITSHNALKDLWLEEMIVTGLTILIGLLSRDGRNQATTSVHSERAAACLLSKLANHLQLGIMMLDHGMDDIEVAFRKQSSIREPITELLTNLIRHNDHTAGGVLNYKFTSLVAVALRDGPCCVQCKAMDFCRELCVYEAGIHALIKDTMLLATCLQVLKSTNCRYVRRLGTSTLDALLRGSNTRQLQALFNQTNLAFNERTQVHLDPNRRRAKDVWIPLTKQTFEMEYGDGDQRERKGVDEKMKSGVKEIVDLVVHVILVEGKIHTDEKSNVTDVRFRPTHDDISCLQEAVNCLKSIANMSEAIMNSNSTHRLLISRGSLCLIDLLHTFSATVFGFTNCVTPDTDRQQRNPEALYLQASMKLWQGAAKRTDSIVDVQEFYDESKLSFVRSVLEFLLCLVEASCNRWSRQLVGQLEEQVLESTNWIEDGTDDDSTALPAQYKYIENIGQAFHDRGLPNSRGVKERRSKVKFAWDENNDHDVGNSGRQCGPKPHGSNSNNSNNKKRHENQWETSVKGNSYHHGNGSGDDLEVTQRRQKGQLVVKKALVKGGVCETVSSWMTCGEERLEGVACDVIQCIIQPQDPEEIHRFATESSKQLNPAQRHHARAQEMADSLAQRDALLSKILSQMSIETADLVSDSLQVKGQDGVKGHSEVKEDEKSKISKKKKKDDDAISVSSTSTSATASKLSNKHSVSAYKPTVKSDKPLAYQTSLTVLDLSGKQLLKSLNQSSSDVKRKQFLVLYDLVAHGDVVMHMTLASYGLHSYLIQFIQKNVQYSVNVLICLTILRNMMGDQRIKQLFISEGGEKFLQRVVKATKGAVKLHAERFLSFLSQGATGLVWS